MLSCWRQWVHVCPQWLGADHSASPSLSEFEPSQVAEKKRTVYQMALSKDAPVCRRMFLSLCLFFLSHPHQVCPLPQDSPRFIPVSLSCVFLFPRLPLRLDSFVLSDKLDEILAAAQQTISTNEASGTRGQGPKRDRGRSFYGNEVCLIKRLNVWNLFVFLL